MKIEGNQILAALPGAQPWKGLRPQTMSATAALRCLFDCVVISDAKQNDRAGTPENRGSTHAERFRGYRNVCWFLCMKGENSIKLRINTKMFEVGGWYGADFQKCNSNLGI